MATTNITLGSGWTLLWTGNETEIQFELSGGDRGEYAYAASSPSTTLVGHSLSPREAVPVKLPAGLNVYCRGRSGARAVVTSAS